MKKSSIFLGCTIILSLFIFQMAYAQWSGLSYPYSFGPYNSYNYGYHNYGYPYTGYTQPDYGYGWSGPLNYGWNQPYNYGWNQPIFGWDSNNSPRSPFLQNYYDYLEENDLEGYAFYSYGLSGNNPYHWFAGPQPYNYTPDYNGYLQFSQSGPYHWEWNPINGARYVPFWSGNPGTWPSYIRDYFGICAL